MTSYEYSVIPAPKRGVKGKGVKGPEALFANALAKVMNEAAADGWEYLRAETLPAEERQGLTGRTTVFQNMLVFRREILVEAPAEVDPVVVEPTPPAPAPAATPELAPEQTPPTTAAEPTVPAFKAHDRPAAE